VAEDSRDRIGNHHSCSPPRMRRPDPFPFSSDYQRSLLLAERALCFGTFQKAGQSRCDALCRLIRDPSRIDNFIALCALDRNIAKRARARFTTMALLLHVSP
jgi:hypothetical protein